MMFYIIISCNKYYTPKPRAYFRIDLPKKEYQYYRFNQSFSFEYPKYGKIDTILNTKDTLWLNVTFSEYNAKLHLSYRKLKNDLAIHTEDIHELAYKHLNKADDIVTEVISKPEKEVYGLWYDIKGNTASSINFYITDSTHHLLRGSFYFSIKPNVDSLAPLIKFFKQDIEQMVNTFEWK